MEKLCFTASRSISSQHERLICKSNIIRTPCKKVNERLYYSQLIDIYIKFLYNSLNTDFSAYVETTFPNAFFARSKKKANGDPSVVALDDKG